MVLQIYSPVENRVTIVLGVFLRIRGNVQCSVASCDSDVLSLMLSNSVSRLGRSLEWREGGDCATG